MSRLVRGLGDRLLERMAPKVTASAAADWCEQCTGPYYRPCWEPGNCGSCSLSPCRRG